MHTLDKSEHVQRHEIVVPAMNRLMFVDVIRVCAIAMVVLLHTSGQHLYSLTSVSPKLWWLANVCDSFTRPAVPLFYMLSGMLLLGGPDEPLKKFAGKRLKKVVIPLVVWSLVYIGWRMYHIHEPFTLGKVVHDLLTSPVYYHLHFMYALMGLYIATPIMRVFVRHASNFQLGMFVGLWFLAVSISPALSKFFGFNLAIHFDLVTGYTGYFVLGYALRNAVLTARQSNLAVAVVAAMTCVAIFGTYVISIRNNGVLDEFFYSYHSPNVIIAAAAMFLLFKSFPHEKVASSVPWYGKAIAIGSALSFGVYLVHVLVLENLAVHATLAGLANTTLQKSVGIPILFLLTVSISSAVTWLLRKIPGLREAVP